jgi:hypothetical protein
MRDAIAVLQQLAQRLEIDVGVPFVVVDEPHSPALQAGHAGCQALGLGHVFGGRMSHGDDVGGDAHLPVLLPWKLSRM